ncbi:MAG: hypothetical protein JNM99_11020 [Verrucomicrobiaceae bacterium]|nr:hypothetical protein [Verrucomicrobiaceae bacterium]
MSAKISALISWSAALVVIVMIAALGWALQRLPDASEIANTKVPRWYPRVTKVPGNALRFYLVFPEPMTTGEIYSHLQLIDLVSQTPVAGAFRDVELWSPDARRLTVWLHPGRQKTGVNLNDDEGPVLIEGRHYALILNRGPTTTRGTALAEDVKLTFTVGPADHAVLDPKAWKVIAPQANSFQALRVVFDKPIDWGMADSITVDGVLDAERLELDDQAGTWSLIPRQRWTEGTHFIEVSPGLEDMAGNNLSRPFEVDVSAASNARPAERKPVRIAFEVCP